MQCGVIVLCDKLILKSLQNIDYNTKKMVPIFITMLSPSVCFKAEVCIRKLKVMIFLDLNDTEVRYNGPVLV